MPYCNGIKKPSEELEEILSGSTSWEKSSEGVRSWARLAIWEVSSEIVKVKDLCGRRRALEKIQGDCRPMVEREVRIMWSKRKR